MRATQNEWHKYRVLGKLHNIVAFIRVLLQRCEAFKKITINKLSDCKFFLPLKTLVEVCSVLQS